MKNGKPKMKNNIKSLFTFNFSLLTFHFNEIDNRKYHRAVSD